MLQQSLVPIIESRHSSDEFASSSGLRANYATKDQQEAKSGIKRRQQVGENMEQKKDLRPYDMIIFAASSSIGQFLVEELALVLGKQQSAASNRAKFGAPRRKSVPSSDANGALVSWAIAGRSAMRLSETLCQAELSTGTNELAQRVPIVLADLNKHESLVNMCKQTRLVLNCAGPYSELGAELLIRAALECRTNYLDLSHETVFNEHIRRAYSQEARRAGVLLLQGCAFQSMSSELGLNFTKQITDGHIRRLNIVLELSDSRLQQTSWAQTASGGLVSTGMWNSLLADKAQQARGDAHTWAPFACVERGDSVHQAEADVKAHDTEFTNAKHTRQLERKDTQSLVKDLVQFRNRNSLSLWLLPVRLVQNSLLKLFALLVPNYANLESSETSAGGYTWPINGLTSDESQLVRCEMSHYELRQPDVEERTSGLGWRPIQCSSFISLKSFAQLCLFCVWLLLFQILVKFSLSRWLMYTFPRLATMNMIATNYSTWSSLVWPLSYLANSRPANGIASFPGLPRALGRGALSHIKYSQTFLAYGTPSEHSGDPLERRNTGSPAREQLLLVSRIVGPEPNHVASATFAIQAALTVLKEREHLPQAGGALTPGAAFAETNIIHQLRKRNIKFEVLKKA